MPEHYFSAAPATPEDRRELDVTLAGRDLRLTTASGVFSGSRLDLGTSVLLRSVPPPTGEHLLDLGCGWGPIALSMALESPDSTVWAVDVNERALALTAENARRAEVTINAVLPDDVPEDVTFDQIWSNPPIRIGKPELHQLLSTWLTRLTDTGSAYLVVQRNLGADSLITWLNDALGPELVATKLGSAKGFRVIEVRRPRV